MESTLLIMSHGKSLGVFRRFWKDRTHDELPLNDPPEYRATSSDRLEANDDPRVTLEVIAKIFSLRLEILISILPVAAPGAEEVHEITCSQVGRR